MEKLVTGPEAADVVDIRTRSAENIRRGRQGQGRRTPEDVTVVHPRPAAARRSWSRRSARPARASSSSSTATSPARSWPPGDGTGIDLLLGIGGTPEGIIAACAMKCMGGVIQGRLWPRDDDERQKALDAGHDLDRVLPTDDLVTGDDCFFVATGITDGELLRGVRYRGRRCAARTRSSCGRAAARSASIESEHRSTSSARTPPSTSSTRPGRRPSAGHLALPPEVPRPVDLLRAQAGAGSLVVAASSPAEATALCASCWWRASPQWTGSSRHSASSSRWAQELAERSRGPAACAC